MAKSAVAKKPSKQLPLMDVQPVTESELTTDAERQEKYRLKQVAKALDEQRHARWTTHNAQQLRRGATANIRECPCTKCGASRRVRTR